MILWAARSRIDKLITHTDTARQSVTSNHSSIVQRHYTRFVVQSLVNSNLQVGRDSPCCSRLENPCCGPLQIFDDRDICEREVGRLQNSAAFFHSYIIMALVFIDLFSLLLLCSFFCCEDASSFSIAYSVLVKSKSNRIPKTLTHGLALIRLVPICGCVIFSLISR